MCLSVTQIRIGGRGNEEQSYVDQGVQLNPLHGKITPPNMVKTIVFWLFESPYMREDSSVVAKAFKN